MIPEKESNKLRFLLEDGPNGQIALINEDYAEVALNGDAVELRGAAVNYYNSDNGHLYFIASPYDGIYMDLPTQDPHIKGYLWNDNGIVKISLG